MKKVSKIIAILTLVLSFGIVCLTSCSKEKIVLEDNETSIVFKISNEATQVDNLEVNFIEYMNAMVNKGLLTYQYNNENNAITSINNKQAGEGKQWIVYSPNALDGEETTFKHDNKQMYKVVQKYENINVKVDDVFVLIIENV